MIRVESLKILRSRMTPAQSEGFSLSFPSKHRSARPALLGLFERKEIVHVTGKTNQLRREQGGRGARRTDTKRKTKWQSITKMGVDLAEIEGFVKKKTSRYGSKFWHQFSRCLFYVSFHYCVLPCRGGGPGQGGNGNAPPPVTKKAVSTPQQNSNSRPA